MSQAPIRVCLRPSPVLASLLVIGHLLGFLAVGISLDGPALGLAGAGVLLSAIWTTGEALQWWADAPLEIELRDGGRGAWRDRQGDWHETRLATGGYVSPWLILVPLARISGRRKWVVIPPDGASREERRRLRVWLRWRNGKIDPNSE